MKNKYPSVSIVINTLNRAKTLEQTLVSLRWQKYSGRFEVIVVNGPSTDNTEEILAAWSDHIRIGVCPVANLSVSRNIGIAMASGEIVAFIDDDAVPEPEWLSQIAEAYDSDEIGGVGGFVFDHTGYQFQYKYCLVDRLGDAEVNLSYPTERFSFPSSYKFPHLLGTNCSFRRSVLLEINGFDEEFEYFLDETDVCLRIIDAGYVIRQLDKAYIHHKYAPNNLRTTHRIVKNYYPILKNKLYFSLKHASDYYTMETILEKQKVLIDGQRAQVKRHIDSGLLEKSDLVSFNKDAEKASKTGLRRAFEKQVNCLTPQKLAKYSGIFHFFLTLEKKSFLTIVLISKDYPPEYNGGIARFIHDLAVVLSAEGHIVHVVTESKDIDRVDFSSGVWIHRIISKNINLTTAAEKLSIPKNIWNWSASALQEVHRISKHRAISVIEAPIWDCEGIAFLLHGAWPLITNLQTTLGLWSKFYPKLQADKVWQKEHYQPVIELERTLMQKSSAIRAISNAVVQDIQNMYQFEFSKEALFISYLGLSASSVPSMKSSNEFITVLFVGRLEVRKGIDVLLKAIPLVLAEMPEIKFKIIGDNTLLNDEGKTYQSIFESNQSNNLKNTSVTFLGKVDEKTLEDAYQSCDIFVSPSRYESFGLIFLEAMRSHKPVIGCAIGGMPEIIANEESGLLIPPDDVNSLVEAILRLSKSQKLRLRMGMRGGALFKEKFTAKIMAENTLPIYSKAKYQWEKSRRIKISYIAPVCVKYHAISQAIRNEINALINHNVADICLYGYKCDYKEIPFLKTDSVADICGDLHFRSSELVVFHFGIYYSLFDLLRTLPNNYKKLVIFHNITPKELVSPAYTSLIDQSLAQMVNMNFADHIICDSETNMAVLRNSGITTEASVLPLAVPIQKDPPSTKPSFLDKIIRIVFIGRFVISKRPQDLLAAMDLLLSANPKLQVQLDMIGNLEFSDSDLLEKVNKTVKIMIKKFKNQVEIKIHGSASDELKLSLLQQADIFALPTYHEGFCVPILEAINNGCQVIAYNNSNTPIVSGGLAELPPTGDIKEFAAAISRTIEKISTTHWQNVGYHQYLQLALTHVKQYQPEKVEHDFINFICKWLTVDCDLKSALCESQKII